MPGYQEPQPNASERPAINEENFVENFEFSPADYQDIFKTSCDQNVNDDYNIF